MTHDWPYLPDGTVDSEAVKALFMTSRYLDWYRFCEDQGWANPGGKRDRLPVKVWIKQKREILAERQIEILSGMLQERRFKWTEQIMHTLDEYPKAIDMGLQLAKAKLAQLAESYQDYEKNWKGKPRTDKRVKYHPFERASTAGQIAAIAAALKGLTEAKLKSLMIDRCSVTKFDLPSGTEGQDGEISFGPKITIEGKETVDIKELANWFQEYADKPTIMVSEPEESTKTVDDANGGY